MANNFIQNELLNFAVYASKQLNASSLSDIIGSFYHDDELAIAKLELCKVQQALATTVTIDGWDKLVNKHGGPIKRQGGEPSQKRLADAEDIVRMLTLLSASKIALPCFIVVNLERVPPITWRCSPTVTMDSNTGAVKEMSDGIASLSTSVNDLLQRLQAVEKQLVTVPATSSATSTASIQAVDVSQPSAAAAMPAGKQPDSNASVSWASRVGAGGTAQSANVSGNSKRMAAHPVACIVKGNRSAGAIKAVQRPLTCFVGRLDLSTTEADLSDYLASVGIPHALCKKLSAKDGRTFNTAAFRVSCCADYREAFYDVNNWPCGAELRDWVFYNTNGSS